MALLHHIPLYVRARARARGFTDQIFVQNTEFCTYFHILNFLNLIWVCARIKGTYSVNIAHMFPYMVGGVLFREDLPFFRMLVHTPTCMSMRKTYTRGFLLLLAITLLIFMGVSDCCSERPSFVVLILGKVISKKKIILQYIHCICE